MIRKLTVMQNEKALIFRNGKLIDVKDQGNYWLWRKTIEKADIFQVMNEPNKIYLYMQNDTFKNMVFEATVLDGQIGILYKNGVYNSILPPGRYVFWKDASFYAIKVYTLNDIDVPNEIRPILSKPDLIKYISVYTIAGGQIGVKYIDGKMEGILNPGTYFYWKTDRSVQVNIIDQRKQILDVLGQEILTSDKANIRLNISVSYQYVDWQKAVSDVKDVGTQLYTYIQMAVREYVGSYSLDQILAEKNSMGLNILPLLQEWTDDIGVKVYSIGIKDIIMPGDIKEILNHVLLAEKKAQANIIMRREETASTRSLLNTAKIMEDNPMLWKLKEMEYVEKIADKVGSISLGSNAALIDGLKDIVISKRK